MTKKSESFKIVVILFILLLVSLDKSSANCVYFQQNTNQLHQSVDSLFVTQHKLRVDLSDLENVTIVEELIIKNNINNSISNIECWLNQSYSNLAIQDREGNIGFEELNLDVSSYLLNLTLNSLLETNQTVRISMEYTLEVDVPLIGGGHKYYNFMFRKSFSYYTSYYEITVRLPETSFIHEDKSNPYSYFPESAKIDTSGDRLYVIWDFSGLQENTEMFVFVLFDPPISGKQKIWVPIVSPILGVFVGAGGVYWWTHRKSKKTMKKVGSIFLTSDQKMFLKLIIDSEGRMSQKEFIKLTGYTKSKISRNLIPLEKQGLIKKEKWGREFRIFITKEGRKVIE